MTLFTPLPGICIIEPFKDTAPIAITNQNQTRLIKGTVIAMGRDLVTDTGSLIESAWYGKKGDIVYFLSYEGNYDCFFENGKKYYAVKVQDMRMIL